MDDAEYPGVPQQYEAGHVTPPQNSYPHTHAVPDTPNGGVSLSKDEHQYTPAQHSQSDQQSPDQPLSSELYSWQAVGDDQAEELSTKDENADQDPEQSCITIDGLVHRRQQERIPAASIDKHII